MLVLIKVSNSASMPEILIFAFSLILNVLETLGNSYYSIVKDSNADLTHPNKTHNQ